MTHRSLLKWLLLTFTAAFCLGLATDIVPALRGPTEWRWARAIPGTIVRLWLPLLCLPLYLGLAYQLQQFSTRKMAVGSVLLAMLFVPLIQLSLLYMDHPDVRSPLFYRTVSDLSGGFFNVGVVAEPVSLFLTRYVERMPDFPVHPQRHPPGLPLLFLLARDWFAANPDLAARVANQIRPFQCHNWWLTGLNDAQIAAATLQMAVPFLLALILPPFYFLIRTEVGSRAAGRTILLFPLVPSIALWATRWNQLYGLFTVICLLALHYGLKRSNFWLLFMAGFTISVASFFSFGNLALAGFAGCYALIWAFVNRDSIKWHILILEGVAVLGGIVSLWLFLFWVDVDLPAMLRTSLSLHYGLQRDYWLWLGYHLYDFFVFLGIPVAVLLAWRVGGALRRRRLTGKEILFPSFVIGLLLLDISGTSQGEVARVWAFLIPLGLAAVAGRLRDRRLFYWILVLLAVQTFVSNIYLRPVGTGLTDPPAPPAATTVAAAEPAAAWASGPVLVDFYVASLASSPSNVIDIDLFWSTWDLIDHPYSIFVHALNEAGEIITQADGQPVQGAWPMPCWQPGTVFEENVRLELPPERSGELSEITLGLYWLPTGERLSTVGTGRDAITLYQAP